MSHVPHTKDSEEAQKKQKKPFGAGDKEVVEGKDRQTRCDSAVYIIYMLYKYMHMYTNIILYIYPS